MVASPGGRWGWGAIDPQETPPPRPDVYKGGSLGGFFNSRWAGGCPIPPQTRPPPSYKCSLIMGLWCLGVGLGHLSWGHACAVRRSVHKHDSTAFLDLRLGLRRPRIFFHLWSSNAVVWSPGCLRCRVSPPPQTLHPTPLGMSGPTTRGTCTRHPRGLWLIQFVHLPGYLFEGHPWHSNLWTCVRPKKKCSERTT